MILDRICVVWSKSPLSAMLILDRKLLKVPHIAVGISFFRQRWPHFFYLIFQTYTSLPLPKLNFRNFLNIFKSVSNLLNADMNMVLPNSLSTDGHRYMYAAAWQQKYYRTKNFKQLGTLISFVTASQSYLSYHKVCFWTRLTFTWQTSWFWWLYIHTSIMFPQATTDSDTNCNIECVMYLVIRQVSNSYWYPFHILDWKWLPYLLLKQLYIEAESTWGKFGYPGRCFNDDN